MMNYNNNYDVQYIQHLKCLYGIFIFPNVVSPFIYQYTFPLSHIKVSSLVSITIEILFVNKLFKKLKKFFFVFIYLTIYIYIILYQKSPNFYSLSVYNHRTYATDLLSVVAC